MRSKVILLAGCILLYKGPAVGQDVSVNGGFLEDTLKIGQPVNYWMSARYPADLNLLFPDSLFSYQPWELVNKTYFPTRLEATMAWDSTVYTLQSFEIDPVQYLNLPAFILTNGDTMRIPAGTDSIYLHQLTTVVSDTTQLITNVKYQEVSQPLDYLLLGVIAGAFVLLAIILFLLFGKQIARKWRLRKLRREYEKISGHFTRTIRELKTQPSKVMVEENIQQWKKFMEKIEPFPYTRATSKEILGLEYTSELKDALKKVDRTIYGGVLTDDLHKSVMSIEDFTQHRYDLAKKRILEGKS